MRYQRLLLVVSLSLLAFDLLAEAYFMAKRENLTGEIAGYLRSVHGRFESYYAERNRRADRGGANETQGGSVYGGEYMDSSGSTGGENADGNNA